MTKNLKLTNYLINKINLVILLLSAIVLSVYILSLTPILYKRNLGILFTGLVSYTLWSIFSWMFTRTFEFEIENEHELDKLKDHESVLLISNHLGALDFMIINEISKKKKMLKNAKYMIKESIKYIPILGHIQFAGYVMMKRNYEKDKRNIIDMLKYFKKNTTPVWFVIYPEGTRYTKEKSLASEKFCVSRNIVSPRNVLYPRSKGFKIAVDEFKHSYVKHVVDLTTYYYDMENGLEILPSLSSFLFGMPSGKIKVRIEVSEIDEIKNPEMFLNNAFYKKDKIIENWKKEDGLDN